MFNPIQIKHECIEIEDINYNGRNIGSNISKFPTFNDEDPDYKYNQLSLFWDHTPSEIRPKTEIHSQQSLFQTEVGFITFNAYYKYLNIKIYKYMKLCLKM